MKLSAYVIGSCPAASPQAWSQRDVRDVRVTRLRDVYCLYNNDWTDENRRRTTLVALSVRFAPVALVSVATVRFLSLNPDKNLPSSSSQDYVVLGSVIVGIII